MNQIHRLGLGVAGLAAVLTVAGALVVDGYVAAGRGVSQASGTQQGPTSTPTTTPTDSATASLDPLTIYVNPAPTAAAVPQTRPATVVAPRPVTPVVSVPDPTPPTIRVIVPTPTEREGEKDD